MHSDNEERPLRSRDVTGYMHRRYAQSHREFGSVRELPHCGGWVLERPIPGFRCTDAMGCYPLFACRDWSQLHLDLEELEGQLVSLCLVTDPFGDYDAPYLHRCFPDLAIPFKEHYVVDLDEPRNKVVSKHHRYEARKALRELEVRVHPAPPEFLDEWMALHEHLIAKHDITGIAGFSRPAFAEQLSTPGSVLLCAGLRGESVAAMLYFVQDDVAYAHVLGCADVGYAHGALYALLGSAIEHFRGTVRWLDVMGVPGGQDAGSEGIRRFKRGWSKETRMAWLCGRILDRERYSEIVQATNTTHASYFPSYRDGEMT